MAALCAPDKLEDLSSDPANTVLRWAEPGTARPDALSMSQVKSLIDELKQEVIDVYRKNPDANEFFLRYNLLRNSEKWSDFATHYPTFWTKLTSASCTRNDVITIHMMVDTRIAFEEGKIEEKEVEAIVQNNLLALNFKNFNQAGSPGTLRTSSSKSSEMLVQQARLRRRLLERTYKDVVVPNEVLRRKPKGHANSLKEILDFYEKPAPPISNSMKPPATVMLLARRFLEIRAGIAEKLSGLPAELQSTGINFMPTFARSAQVEITLGQPIKISPEKPPPPPALG